MILRRRQSRQEVLVSCACKKRWSQDCGWTILEESGRCDGDCLYSGWNRNAQGGKTPKPRPPSAIRRTALLHFWEKSEQKHCIGSTDPETTHGDMTHHRHCVSGARHSDLDQQVGDTPLPPPSLFPSPVMSRHRVSCHVQSCPVLSCKKCHVMLKHVQTMPPRAKRQQAMSSHVSWQFMHIHVLTFHAGSCHVMINPIKSCPVLS